MGGDPVWVPEEHRAITQLANGANHLVTLLRSPLTCSTLRALNILKRLLGSLLFAALDNSLRSGDSALTGPVVLGMLGLLLCNGCDQRGFR